MKRILSITLILAVTHLSVDGQSLEQRFANPPDEYRPWVFWHWTNGNVTRDGISKDLEGMKEVGIGGVITFRISGPNWAPPGPLKTGMENQLPMIRWAAEEAERLGIHFSLVIDYGYGSGGPHVTPDLSMQRLYQTETKVEGGKAVRLQLPKPKLEGAMKEALRKAWLRPGSSISPGVIKDLKSVDSYRDVAVFAIPTSHGANIPKLDSFNGLFAKTAPPPFKAGPGALSRKQIIDLTKSMNEKGELTWKAPAGKWTVIRLGYATNFKLTRPSPAPEVGLECDRIHPRGLDRHFDHRLKPVLDALNQDKPLVDSIFIDSWEAGSQNWTEGFPSEFEKRRGYNLKPWLPVLAGRVVESADKSERFLWDFRQTISEAMLTHYIDRLEKRLKPYGIESFYETYGNMCVDPLTWGGRGTFPVAEFWSAPFRKLPVNPGDPAGMDGYCYTTIKALASAANTYGKPRVGAESFTGSRGWSDHPYLVKGMGDHAFSEGVSHVIFHLSAHQPYDDVRPGFTHKRWGQHYQRHQTWWEFSPPYMTYLARCHTLLQQGRRVVDVACLLNEGAPFDLKRYKFPSKLPVGYDLDFCTPEIIQRMTVLDGQIVVPTGVRYRYLEVIPDRLTLPTARKIDELRKAGAKIYCRSAIKGTPGLAGFPASQIQVKKLTKDWPRLPADGWGSVLMKSGILPDFEGGALRWLHRRTADEDIYFVANTEYEPVQQVCIFRVKDREPELWDPETGRRFALPFERLDDGRAKAAIEFGPAQSWFVVFRARVTAPVESAFYIFEPITEIQGPWSVEFDPEWGSDKAHRFDQLNCWTKSDDPLVKYYSGTATYRKTFNVNELPDEAAFLDLGRVEVMARVFLNGKDLGITWKPPYRVEVTGALKRGKNELEVQVVNTWNNRLIGDEQLPLDSEWKDWETLFDWPDWFPDTDKRPSGRYTFTTARHYKKDSKLQPAGLFGPVSIMVLSKE